MILCCHNSLEGIELAAPALTLIEWTELLRAFHFPRWGELPEIELYADQVVVYIERHLGELFAHESRFITASMIHNYVKLGLMPKPVKKRYGKEHVAHLLTITVLKQVLAISDISGGILSQVDRANNGYDLFCDEIEFAIGAMLSELAGEPRESKSIESGAVAVRMAAYAVVSKMIAQNHIKLTGGERHEHTQKN